MMSARSSVLVTGASGFVGKTFCTAATVRGYSIKAAVRTLRDGIACRDQVVVGEVDGNTDWSAPLVGVEKVVHLAARVPVRREQPQVAFTEFRRVNVAGTERLARAAAASGVKRFVFVSSIKVNGEVTMPDRPFRPDDAPAPEDAYAISKLEAEQSLLNIARETGMEVVIIRPALVYGPAVKGNFATMMNWVARGIPIPLGAVRNNRRSLVGVDNLADLIIACLNHPKAANQVFLASDGEDLSTAELLKRVANVMGHAPRLLIVPIWMLSVVASSLGTQALADRLLGSLQVDSSKAREMLGWEPPVSVDEGLRRAISAQSFSVLKAELLIRLFDAVFSLLGLILCMPLLALLWVIAWFDTGFPLFRQVRVGRHQRPFVLMKFRTMRPGTASVATHLADASATTSFGRFLRRTKLDELPQLWNVLKGEMSLVGPRPCLFNQEELIRERVKREVFNVRPGVTGLAQVNNIDMSTPRLLAETDAQMVRTLSLFNYFKYLLLTVMGKGAGDRVRPGVER
jgi:nucleoside-diphosphate-sugar epimerase/lipopolysaccharide/colanic/teichoic acid biosynthesis glycosyltransferase